MAFRGIQEYIARDANNIAPKKSHPILFLLFIEGFCVSSYYLTIVSDCRLPFCLFANRTPFRAQTYDGYSALHTQNSMHLNGGILSVECES